MAAPGAPLSIAEKDDWTSRTMSFMAKKRKVAEDAPSSIAKRVKSLAVLPRKASMDFGLCLSSALRNSRNKGLEMFAVPEEDKDRAFDDDLRPGETLQPMAVGSLDEEQKQWTFLSFAVHVLNLSMIGFPDNFHVRSNGVWRALAKSAMVVWTMLAMVVCNIAYGPWQKGGFHTQMVELSLDLVAACDADDPILIKLWPSICEAKGWREPEECCREARSRYIESLASAKAFTVKGKKTAPSKFFTIQQAWKIWAPELPKCFGLVHLAKEKGWCTHWEDLFTAQAELPKPAAAPSGSGAASSSSAVAEPLLPMAPDAVGGGAATSAAKGRAQGKAKLDALMKRSQNALHAVARALCDYEFVTNMNLSVLFTEPLGDEHSQYAHALKGCDSVKMYYSDMAKGKWCEPLQKTVARLGDLRGLKKAGFDTVFPSSVIEKLKVSDARVLMQDALAASAFNLVAHLLSERCLSMSVHMECCPELIAGINSLDEKERDATMQLWKLSWEAYAAARHQKTPVLQDMCERSPLNSRAMESCARVARSSEWKLTSEVQEIGHILFGGFGHTLMIERGNQKVRDAETRDGTSTNLNVHKAWNVLVTSQTLGAHDRKETEHTMDLPAPRMNGGSLFRPDEDDKQSLKFEKILEEKTWPSPDARGRRRLAGEASLLRYLHENTMFNKADDAWKASLVPKHCVLLKRGGGLVTEIALVLEVFPSGVLTWPVQRKANASLQLDCSGPVTPRWQHIFSLENLFIIPIETISPLHCAVQGNVPLPNIGILCNHKAPVPLLEYQALRGFAGVPEKILLALYADMDFKVPEPDAAADYENMLVLGIMEELLADLDLQKATQILATRIRLMEAEGDTADLMDSMMSSDIIDDVAGRSERQFCKNIIDDSKKSAERRVTVGKKNENMLKKKFGIIGKGAKKKPKTLSAKVKLAMASSLTDKRWWNEILGDTTFIEANAPAVGRVCKDDDNGRFLVLYPSRTRRSFSWTVRGMNRASLVTLKWWWEAHTEATGEQPPEPLQKLFEV